MLLTRHLTFEDSRLVLSVLLLLSLMLRWRHLLLLSESRRAWIEIGGISLDRLLLLLPHLLRVRTEARLALTSSKERAVLHLLTGSEM